MKQSFETGQSDSERPSDIRVRKWVTLVEEIQEEMGESDTGPPLRKAVAAVVVRNPHSGRYVQSLQDLVDASARLAEELAERAAAALGAPIESYGKAAIVGVAGDQEHGNALLTSVFGDVVRHHASGGKAWIPSMTKRASAGTSIDIPLAFKDALYVRSHYDGITLCVADAPGPDEIVLIAAYASRGRINARVGGLTKPDVNGEDGLR